MLGAGLLGEVHQLVRVLADKPLLVVAGNVVPHRAVSIEVVQHGNASLVMLALDLKFPIVRLRFSRATCFAPGSGHLAIPTAQPHIGTRPEPTVCNCWLQVGTVTAVKVTFP